MKNSRIRIVAVAATILVGLIGIQSHASPEREGRRPEASAAASGERAQIRDVYVIHFILDGLNRAAFEDALKEGKIPTLQKHFVDGGARFTEALSSFPTTSTSIYQAFATGLLPGHAGIPHLERFDRQRQQVIGYLTAAGYRQLNRDLINLRALTNPAVAELEPPTSIFELLRGWPTAAVYSSFYRGATEVYPRIAPIGALWDTYVEMRPERVDPLAMRRVEELFARPLDRIPRYMLVGLYSTDIMGHKHGPQSAEVTEVLEQFDCFLREFLAQLEKRGLADKTYIILSADHGMHETGELFLLNEALAERGITVKPRNPRDHDYTLYAANRGVVSSHLYVRHDGGFEPLEDPEVLRHLPLAGGGEIDLIDFLRSLPATDLLIARSGPRSARIMARDGAQAEVVCTEVNLVEYCSYRPQDHARLASPAGDVRGSARPPGTPSAEPWRTGVAGGAARDPLGYREVRALAKLLDGQPHSTFAWEEATAAQAYPDGVVALSQIFHDGRAGDLFVTTRGHYGFRKVKEGNHGGPGSDDMRIPLLIAGPGVRPGTYGAARPVDIYPLLLAWFGLDAHEGSHDGRNPFARFAGDDPLWQALARLDQALVGQPPLVKGIDADAFARSSVLPLAAARDRPALRARAEEEARRRGELVEKLRAYRERLTSQREAGAKGPVDPAYLEDHLEIVARELRWAEEGLARMEAIEEILSGCARRGSCGAS